MTLQVYRVKKESSIRDIFSKKLRENRRKIGYTQEKLAEIVGISTHYLAMLETGRNFPTSDTLERLAAALEIPVYELFIVDQSPKEELEQLRQDIVNEIYQIVSKAIKQSFVEESKNYKNRNSIKTSGGSEESAPPKRR
jgi:transcriptional regulator with XRE-family HTH domain